MNDRSRRGRGLGLVTAAGVLALAVLFPLALGADRALTFDPSSADYGTLDAGTSASKTFTLTNSGGAASGALTVSLTGSPAFSMTADTCAGNLGRNKSCSVTVRYAPTTAGASDTGTLTAVSNKSAVATASLTGESRSPSQTDCESAPWGGTFATGTSADVLWKCSTWSYADGSAFTAHAQTLASDCTGDGGVAQTTGNLPTGTGDLTADTVCSRVGPLP